jgi:hypothetical protein
MVDALNQGAANNDAEELMLDDVMVLAGDDTETVSQTVSRSGSPGQVTRLSLSPACC